MVKTEKWRHEIAAPAAEVSQSQFLLSPQHLLVSLVWMLPYWEEWRVSRQRAQQTGFRLLRLMSNWINIFNKKKVFNPLPFTWSLLLPWLLCCSALWSHPQSGGDLESPLLWAPFLWSSCVCVHVCVRVWGGLLFIHRNADYYYGMNMLKQSLMPKWLLCC